MRNTLRSVMNLLASLLVALSPSLALAEKWDVYTTPQGIAEPLGIVGGVLLAWLSRSPRDGKLPPRT